MPDKERLQVAIIGAGGTGSRLAALAAAAGYSVVLEDLMPARLRQAAAELAEPGLAPGAAAAGSVRFAGSVEDAVRIVDLVVDFVPDELESKLEILSLIDRMAPPHAVILTPTASLSIADLASCTYRGERCLGVRFQSTALQAGEEIRLIVIAKTDCGVIEMVSAFWSSLGFVVVHENDPAEASVTAGTLF